MLRDRSESIWIRLGAVVVLLGGEIWLLRERYTTDALEGDGRAWATGLRLTRYLAPLVLTLCASTLLFAGGVLRRELAAPSGSRPRPWRAGWLVLAHAGAFAAFYTLTAVLLEAAPGRARSPYAELVLWACAALALVASLVLAAAPADTWGRAVHAARHGLAAAVALGLTAFALSQVLLETSLWLPLGRATLWLSAGILGLFTRELVYDPDELIVGTSAFGVQVTRFCSGYEGVALFLVFASGYVWLFRGELRFPRALWVLPLGTLVMWCANALRIACLVGVGTRSPRIAAAGFHSHAGWILFCGVALGLVAIASRTRVLARRPPPAAAPGSVNPTAAYLAPLLAIVAVGLVTGAFASGVDRLYPLRVLASAALLAWFWREYPLRDLRPSAAALAAGALACGLWIALASKGDAGSPALEEIGASGSLIAGVWLAFRVLGAVLTAPLSEELAFRGFLARRLVAADFERVRFERLSVVGLFLSSLAFGALHQQRWIAGTLVGAIFAAVAMLRGRLSDAVVAHATCNALLIVVAAVSGRWSLWL